MHIHAASHSAAVCRTLDALILATGHTPSAIADADYLIVDAAHPPAEPLPPLPQLCLASDTATSGTLACPVALRDLRQHLAALHAPKRLALANGWEADLSARALTHPHAAHAPLTEKEADLLAALHQTYPAAIGRDALLAHVWGIRQEVDTHTLETHIYRLRQKLGSLAPTPCDLVTEEGSYRLVLAPQNQ